MSLKRILITNDDGITAPGLIALEQSLAALGEVTVIAPDREMSASSQAISLHVPLRLGRRILRVKHHPDPPHRISARQDVPIQPDLPLRRSLCPRKRGKRRQRADSSGPCNSPPSPQ